MEIYERVKLLRKIEGWTIKELAIRSGLKYVGQMESGYKEIHVGDLVKLSRVFNVKVDDLLDTWGRFNKRYMD